MNAFLLPEDRAVPGEFLFLAADGTITTDRERPKTCPHSLRFVCISDTHGQHDSVFVPDGDVLIHAGDITETHSDHPSAQQVEDFNRFLGRLPHAHKFVVAGNHDGYLESLGMEETTRVLSNCTYLQDTIASVTDNTGHEIKIFGSPLSLKSGKSSNTAFQIARGSAELKDKWNKIPYDTQILVTHGPPFSFGDSPFGGCEDLLQRVKQIRPSYHIYGHIHTRYGIYQLDHGDLSEEKRTYFVNASSMSHQCLYARRAVVFDFPSI